MTSKKRKQPKRETMPAIEREYLTVFSPAALPARGLYTDGDSLEQPSELTYVPSRATPYVEAYELK